MKRQPGWLVLALTLLVIGLCLSQRLGLMSGCTLSAHQNDAVQLEAPAFLANSDAEGQCSLSEQLLMKVWSQLEPMLFALLLLVSLWLLPPRAAWFCRRFPPPRPFAGRRRHLVLCVFRE